MFRTIYTMTTVGGLTGLHVNWRIHRSSVLHGEIKNVKIIGTQINVSFELFILFSTNFT